MLEADKTPTITKAEIGLGKFGYGFSKEKFSFSKVANSLRSTGPIFCYCYKDLSQDPSTIPTLRFSWICDGSHVSIVTTEYKVMVYSGDFADIDPTAAFYTHATDTSNATSDTSVHFVWCYGNSMDGYYYNTDWTVNYFGNNINISGNEVQTLLNIYPK